MLVSCHMATSSPRSYYAKQLEYLKDVFTEQYPDWTVFTSSWVCSEADFSKHVINLRKYQDVEKQLYVFLHEVGHVILCSRKDYQTRFELAEQRNYGTDGYKINRVEEELEAWHEGYKFAVKHKLMFDKKKFERVKTKLIKSYFNWALGRLENIKGKEQQQQLK